MSMTWTDYVQNKNVGY